MGEGWGVGWWCGRGGGYERNTSLDLIQFAIDSATGYYVTQGYALSPPGRFALVLRPQPPSCRERSWDCRGS